MKVLITGATSGIGYRLAVELAKRNHTVYLTTHTVKQCYEVKEKLKVDMVDALVFKMDITNGEDIELIEKLDFDVLVNHAGVGVGGTLLYMDIDKLKENYEVNIFASFRLLQKAFLKMEKNKIKGKIFVTGSLAGYLPIPFLGCYTSSKAAIGMLSRTIKKELEYLKSDIHISLIEPGAYDTGFNKLMVENKTLYMPKGNKVYKNIEEINKLQKNMFTLIEKDNYDDLIKKVIVEMEKEKPAFLIRRPIGQSFFTKIYRFWD